MANTIQHTPNNIIIEIPDLIINNTIIKRKAQLFTLVYNQSAKYVSLNWIVKHYSVILGQTGEAPYGEYLGSTIQDYSYESVASNLTSVNPATGEIIFKTDIVTTNIISPETIIPEHTVVIPAIYDVDGITVLTPEVTEMIPEQIIPELTEDIITNDYVMDYMGQYDWFNMIAELMPIQIHEMIRQYGQNVSLWKK